MISDVMMPLMDGIELVSKIREKYPEIFSVIVSGYSDFEYAKGAIHAGVCEYILKPVRVLEIVQLMDKLRKRLDMKYYERRKKVLKEISFGYSSVLPEELRGLFPDEKYYAAVYRKNGLPSRFSFNQNRQTSSLPEETMIVYGRDEMEALYLCPYDTFNGSTFNGFFKEYIEKKMEDEAFYTVVINAEPVSAENMPAILKELYQKLTKSVVIGKTQILNFSDPVKVNEKMTKMLSFHDFEYYFKRRDYEGISREWKKLINLWKCENCPQIFVEEQIRYLIAKLLEKKYMEDIGDFILDDIFSNVLSMEELEEEILALFCAGITQERNVDHQEVEYQEIMEYLKEHLSDSITAQKICKEFALSQTSLSKLFHKYGDCNFNRCLTMMRMKRAKDILRKDGGALIRDVAEQVGYSDQFYFSRVFRAYYGASPSEYVESEIKNAEKG